MKIQHPETLWSKIKEAINSYEIGEEFTRKDIREKLNYPEGGSFDLYRLDLTHAGIISKVGPALFKKNCNIPETLTTTKLHRFLIEERWKPPTWKNWFIELEDRLRSL